MIKHLKNEESGYSLVEVVVAIMLLSLAIIPMVGMFDAALRAAVVGSNYDRARAVANQKLEDIRALPYVEPGGTADSVVEIYPPMNGPSGGGAVPCEGAVPADLSCEVETNYVSADYTEAPPAIEPDSSARTMLEATVTVRWDGNSKDYSTTGLISKGTG